MRADITQVRSAQRQELPVGIERKLGLDGQITALIIAEEGLRPLAGPLDGTADAFRCPCDQRELGEERVARAEIARDQRLPRGLACLAGYSHSTITDINRLSSEAPMTGPPPTGRGHWFYPGDLRNG